MFEKALKSGKCLKKLKNVSKKVEKVLKMFKKGKKYFKKCNFLMELKMLGFKMFEKVFFKRLERLKRLRF